MHEFGNKETVPIADKLSLSTEEASALTGIGLTSIRQAVNSEALVARKQGTRTIILRDELEAWLKTLPKAGKKAVSATEGEK
jgi:excisionase family DNA binding protein